MKVDEIKSKTSEAVSYRGQRQALVGTMRVTQPTCMKRTSAIVPNVVIEPLGVNEVIRAKTRIRFSYNE